MRESPFSVLTSQLHRFLLLLLHHPPPSLPGELSIALGLHQVRAASRRLKWGPLWLEFPSLDTLPASPAKVYCIRDEKVARPMLPGVMRPCTSEPALSPALCPPAHLCGAQLSDRDAGVWWLDPSFHILAREESPSFLGKENSEGEATGSCPLFANAMMETLRTMSCGGENRTKVCSGKSLLVSCSGCAQAAALKDILIRETL